MKLEKAIKYILFVVIALILINFGFTLVGSNDIKQIRKNLESADRSADSALRELQYSKTKIDEIRSDMNNLQTYLTHIQKFVNLNEAEKMRQEANSQEKIKAAQHKIDSLRQDISNDSLPPIDELPVKKNN